VRDDTDDLRRRYFDNVAVTDLAVSLHTRQADGPRGGPPVPAVLRPRPLPAAQRQSPRRLLFPGTTLRRGGRRSDQGGHIQVQAADQRRCRTAGEGPGTVRRPQDRGGDALCRGTRAGPCPAAGRAAASALSPPRRRGRH
jgi:hypothetical protein